jgi:vanadium-dependent haloperoxidase-like protein
MQQEGRRVTRVSWLLVACIFGRLSLTEAALPPGNTVQQWNKIAEDTVLAGGAIQNEALLYMSYESAAVYDAVVAINGGFQPYALHIAAPPGASVQAAVIEAAYRVLQHYFPAQSVTLNAYRTEALAAVSDGSVTDGIEVGAAAAHAVITLRDPDGRLPIGTTATIDDPICAPGGYRQTPGGNWTLGPQTPWLGEVTPFLLAKAGQFHAPQPPPLTSRRWVEQFEEIRRVGGTASEAQGNRTPEQSAIARFWGSNVLRQYNLLGRDLVTQRALTLLDSARLLAMINMVAADAQINVFHAKYEALFWRPVTAIDPTSVVKDWCDMVPGYEDNNDATFEEHGWRPLLATPNHPEYPGAHGSITSAIAEVLSEFLGTDAIGVTIHGSADGTAGNLSITRYYATAADLREEIVNARLWAGLHYRGSTEAAVALGAKVAHYALHHGFKPAH